MHTIELAAMVAEAIQRERLAQAAADRPRGACSHRAGGWQHTADRRWLASTGASHACRATRPPATLASNHD